MLTQGLDVGRHLWRSWVKDPYFRLAQAVERKRYGHVWDKQLTAQQANSAIVRMLVNRQPCLVGRIGHTEGRIVGEALFRHGRFGRLTHKEAHQYSGIFPVDPSLLARFAEIYRHSIAQADLLGFWQTTFQAKLFAEYYPNLPLTPLPALEPYLQSSPWSAFLEGRRVLVIHPFASTILRQYSQNRTRLFSNPQILPEFELKVLAAPQTLAPLTGGYASWIEALDDLIARVNKYEFDVALLGCGAYALPLGAAIKKSGRQAIHLGGALQVLFGIRGRRWEAMPPFAALMNEHWVRPLPEETPQAAAQVDGGCYW